MFFAFFSLFMEPVDIPRTFGALLIGGLFATFLSGAVALQVLVYFKLFSNDNSPTKSIVLITWFIDTCHTGFIWGALWQYLIDGFGLAKEIDAVPWTISLSIAFTAVLTFMFHCFLANRIFMLSRRNWFLTIPIIFLAVLRLVSAGATTGELLRLRSFDAFMKQFRWLFTLGLALSSAADILITSSLLFLLRTNRSASMTVVIDLLIRYAFETGFLTAAGTIIAMICYIVMSDNLIFLGLHFSISKLYANSLLVTLNARQQLRQARATPPTDIEYPILQLDTRRKMRSMLPSSSITGHQNPKGALNKLEISVERSVQYETRTLPIPLSTSKA